MTARACWHAASVIAIGLLIGLAAPSHAASDTDETPAAKPVKHVRHVTHHHSKPASKAADSKKEADTADNSAATPGTIPPLVADANAQATIADTTAGNAVPAPAADAEPAITNNMTAVPPPTGSQPAGDPVVAADQLNEVDRSLQDNEPASPAVVASNDTSAQPSETSSDQHSIWDETSLIGKIFIGFGTLLTIASAARMFIA